MKTYNSPVTRIEELQVTEPTLQKEAQFQLGKLHRQKGLPCMSSNGAYLNGWYSPEKDFYYITKEAAHLLNHEN